MPITALIIHALPTGRGLAPPRRVLVVEDDAVNRTYLRLTLEQRGCQVLPVRDVETAQQEFSQRGPDHFDCVSSDYWLPDQTGLDWLRWLKAADPSLAAIRLTAEVHRTFLFTRLD